MKATPSTGDQTDQRAPIKPPTAEQTDWFLLVFSGSELKTHQGAVTSVILFQEVNT